MIPVCGIAAILDTARPEQTQTLIQHMTSALIHRGPDDEGIWRGKFASLGNRRLSIIDLSETGHQPMVDPATGTVISFNGEIYGHQNLRALLEYPFRGSSDTETVLAAWQKWGTDTFWHLRGMFALVIWDAPRQRLVIARDRFGIKPIFWAHDPAGRWLVASETRAIRAAARFEPDWISLASFLRLGHVPSPRTAFQGIHELPPGHYAVIDGDGIVLTPYWEVPPAHSHRNALGSHSSDPTRSGIPPLQDLFKDAVRSHLQSDVPVGLFAGGGTDSHAIAKVTADTGTHLDLLHVLGDHDDSKNALAIAQAYNWPFRVCLPDPGRDDLDAFIAAIDQPTVDGLNTWFAARLAKQYGFKVVLSGIGGDELFGGYKTYRQVPLIRWFQRIVPQGNSVLGAQRAMLPYPTPPGTMFALSNPRLEDALTEPRTFKTAYVTARGLFSRRETLAITQGPLQEACRTLDLNTVLPNGKDVREMELRAYMHNQLLRDADVFGMSHGVEIRPVFLDHPFAEKALTHPITRKQFCRALGLPAPGRKRGFSLPLDKWLSNRPGERGAWNVELPHSVIDPMAYHKVAKQHWSRSWALMVLALWLRQNA